MAGCASLVNKVSTGGRCSGDTKTEGMTKQAEEGGGSREGADGQGHSLQTGL
jgi:hypothetical protein